jgi:DNA invertase Pin-like site-specific DNA recombinase
MTTAVVYIRQSRTKEREKTVSLEVQEASCRALPAVQRCGDQVEVFRDEDTSGGKRARRGYDAMLERIRAGGVGVVSFYDQSRAFRSTLIAAEFKALLEEPPHAAIEVVFAHGNFDRSPVGGFSYAVLAAAHEMERRMTGEKIRDAYRLSAKKGVMVGQVPGGYRRKPAADGKVTFDSPIIVDEDVAPTVRRIFSEYASGRYSAREIAMRLNDKGIPPLPRSRGAGWRFYSIVELLRNVAYTGQTFSESRRRKGKGQLIPDAWPAIIEPELWEAAQRQLSRYNGRGGRRPRGQERPYIFLGLLRCSCGARLSAAFRDGKAQYLCPRGDDTKPCTEHRTREVDLLSWAGALFEQLEELTPADFGALVASLNEERLTSPGAVQSIDRTLERQRKLYSWGHISEDDYLREAARLEELRGELAAETPEPTIQLRGLLDAWNLGDAIARREMLAVLFDCLHVSDGHIVGYTARADRQGEVLKIMEALRGRLTAGHQRGRQSITAHHDRHFPQHGIDQPADLGLSIRRRCLAKYATLVDVDSSTSQSNPDSRISSN